jgi:uncharacterized protein with GYD domain
VAKKNNATVRDIFWTLGAHDVVSIVDAPSDEAIISVGLALGTQGNVRTQTLRAFSATEMSKLLGGLD